MAKCRLGPRLRPTPFMELRPVRGPIFHEPADLLSPSPCAILRRFIYSGGMTAVKRPSNTPYTCQHRDPAPRSRAGPDYRPTHAEAPVRRPQFYFHRFARSRTHSVNDNDDRSRPDDLSPAAAAAVSDGAKSVSDAMKCRIFIHLSRCKLT